MSEGSPPCSAQNFRRYGVGRLARPDKIALFFDHYAPADTPLHAHVQRVGRKMFEQFKLPGERLFDVGEGISHQIAVESGMVRSTRRSNTTAPHWRRWGFPSG